MFESIKQTDRTGGFKYLASLLISLIAHAVVVCLLLIVPLIFFGDLEANDVVTFLITPPAVPPAPDPPAPPPSIAASQQGRTIQISQDIVPVNIPVGIPAPDDREAVEFDPRALVRGLEGIPSPVVGARRDIIAELVKPAEQPPDPAKPPNPRTPVRVGYLQQSRVIHQVPPVYPILAIKARVEGTVLLEAVIDDEGNVTTVKVLSGHTLLVDAAVNAVKQWKYSPTILSGEPIPILALVNVEFHLTR